MSAAQGRVERQTRAHLRRLKATQTPLGASAIVIAQLIDAGEGTRDLTAASRELRMLLREVTTAYQANISGDEDEPTRTGPTRLDEVRQRRERNRGQATG